VFPIIQDIAPHLFQNEYRELAPDFDSFAICPGTGKILVKRNGEELSLPRFNELGIDPETVHTTYLFAVDGHPCFLVEQQDTLPECKGCEWAGMDVFRDAHPHWIALAGVTALQLAKWYRENRFCGGCGGAMAHHAHERALVCQPCGITLYPRISPAVIVAVTDGNRILLSRYANRPNSRYALVAGFAEIGEAIEETVRREVMEEVGLRVKNLRFYKSQPWAFSDSLLFGFFCELDGPPDITLDETELAEATWFPRAEVPPAISDISLTSEMMERFRAGEN
jgi:NAD+ diphosphatase